MTEYKMNLYILICPFTKEQRYALEDATVRMSGMRQ